MNENQTDPSAAPHDGFELFAAGSLPQFPESVIFTLAGVRYEVHRMPWKKCRRLMSLLSGVGSAMSAGRASDEKTLDDMTAAIAMAADLSLDAINEMPVEPLEVYRAFHGLLAITGMDRFQRAEFQRLRELLKDTVPEHVLVQALSGVFQPTGSSAEQAAN